MNRLLGIGFEPAGHWLLVGGDLAFTLSRHASQRNILYAFVSDGEVQYVGKTIQSLYARMGGYKNPSSSQTTNVRNNTRIKALLQAGAAVDILALPDNGLMHYGQFHLNLAAGLEDSLIAVIAPPWNRVTQGREVSSAPVYDPSGDPPAEPIDQPPPSDHESDSPRRGLADAQLSQIPGPIAQFLLVVQKTYYRMGFFNVGVGQSTLFGGDGQEIEIFCGDAAQPIIGTINRTANNNQTPRIMGGKGLRDWFQRNVREMQEVHVTLLSPNAIRIEPGNA